MPDPFHFADGRPVATRADWACRRAGLSGIGTVSLDNAELQRMGIALITFPNNRLGEQMGSASRGKGGFYDLYGKDHPASSMTAWSWGVSRLIDALERTPAAGIDPRRLLVTENTSMEWLGNQSAWYDALAAREIWKALGNPQAMGVSQADFARHGDPNGHGLPAWPRYTRANDQMMDFTDTGKPAAQEDPWGAEIEAAQATRGARAGSH